MWSLHVCFLQPPIHHRGKHSKTGSKNRRNCVTHSTATLSCMLSTNPRQSSFRCYAPSALRAAGDPKPTLYTYNNTWRAKDTSLNSALPFKWALFQNHTQRVCFCWLCRSLVRNSWEDQLPLVYKAQAWLPTWITAWHINKEVLILLSLATFLFLWDFQLRKLCFTSTLKCIVFNIIMVLP